eukprot:Polyplicarium_translucidae@DN3338_c0_g1_i1.p1
MYKQNMVQPEAQAVFTTKIEDPKFAAPLDGIFLKAELRQEQLSDLLSELLGIEKMKFEFLVFGKLLRSSLAEAMADAKVTSENVLEIEYFFAFGSPQRESSSQLAHAWIMDLAAAGDSCIGALSNGLGAVLASDAKLTRKMLPTSTRRMQETRCICADVVTHGSGGIRVFVGYADGRVCTGVTDDPEDRCLTQTCLAGNSVNCIAWNKEQALLLCGTEDSRISAWDSSDLLDVTQVECENVKKRRLEGTEHQVNPRAVSDSHGGAVLDLCFIHDDTAFLSTSADQTAGLWNASVTGRPVSTFVLPRPCFSLSASRLSTYFATSHDDGSARIWDLRINDPSLNVGDTTIPQCYSRAHPYRSNRSVASRVAWNPLNDNYVAVASQDKQLSLIDIRSAHQAVAVEKSTQKLLALAWTGPMRVGIGGSRGVFETVSFV